MAWYPVVAGWVHYLAFYLRVGSWELADSKKYSIPFGAVTPCLFLTFMLGRTRMLTNQLGYVHLVGNRGFEARAAMVL
jgi:hypothetical protein